MRVLCPINDPTFARWGDRSTRGAITVWTGPQARAGNRGGNPRGAASENDGRPVRLKVKPEVGVYGPLPLFRGQTG